MKDSDDAQLDYQALRDTVVSAQIATLASDDTPDSSYAPFVWLNQHPYLYLSELAQHTQNLRRNPAVSLMLIEDEAQARNPFARRRIYLQGTAQYVARDDDLFNPVLDEFRRRFGAVMEVIEPLPDFHLFRIIAQRGRFIRGFGQAYTLSGDDLGDLQHIDPRKK